jgi:hypothetical protein
MSLSQGPRYICALQTSCLLAAVNLCHPPQEQSALIAAASAACHLLSSLTALLITLFNRQASAIDEDATINKCEQGPAFFRRDPVLISGGAESHCYTHFRFESHMISKRWQISYGPGLADPTHFIRIRNIQSTNMKPSSPGGVSFCKTTLHCALNG